MNKTMQTAGQARRVTRARTGLVAAAASLLAVPAAQALTFGNDQIQGSFDSTLSIGGGVRLQSPSADLVSPLYGAGGLKVGGGRMGQFAGPLDQGNINYARGDLFTGYLKGSHELLLKMPSEQLTFMARANWLRDFAATHTTGDVSGQDPFQVVPPALRHGLPEASREDMRFKARLLDFWVSKTFQVSDQQVRVRVGNQVISWGENIYEVGGINATNAIDVNRASQPGTQIKEFVLPAPAISVATGLGNGLAAEAYVQTNWNESYLPPVGSYWSTSAVGPGSGAYGVKTHSARNGGQWGASLRYQPPGSDLNLGFYVMNYHDKVPNLSLDASGLSNFHYLEDRVMVGVSGNANVGDWAIGSELSYRPRDAVSLNPAGGCAAQGGRCWVDEKRLQWHLTTLFSLTPSNAGSVLDFLGASTATLTTETVAIWFPGLHKQYGGTPIGTGGWLWGNEYNDVAVSGAINAPGDAVGTKRSGGINVDFNWVYDGTLIQGWQVNPGVFVRRGLFGRTPTASAQFVKGVTALNLYVNFQQNPAHWQIGLNYTRFMGGDSLLDNPVKDRDFVGLVVSRNF